jgi:voltage-gated potassium channel
LLKFYKLKIKIPAILSVLLVLDGILHIFMSVLPLFENKFHILYEIKTNIFPQSCQNLGIIIGVFLGFCLIFISKGVCDGKRKSWLIAIIIILIFILDNFLHYSVIKAAVINITLLIILLASYRLFHLKSINNSMLYKQLAAWVSVIVALSYGTFGSYILRDQFTNIKTVTDAFYFTIVTYATVGYGDIIPLTQEAKLFTVTMIFVGMGSFITTLSFLIAPIVQNRMGGIFKIMRKITNLHDHTIICGYTKLTKVLIQNYQKTDKPFIVIDESSEKLSDIDPDINKIVGNTSCEQTFIDARLSHAKAVICAFDEDSDNILTILTVKEMLDEMKNIKIKLISRIENESNIEKAKKLGVTDVVSPTTMAALSIIEMSDTQRF